MYTFHQSKSTSHITASHEQHVDINALRSYPRVQAGMEITVFYLLYNELFSNFFIAVYYKII